MLKKPFVPSLLPLFVIAMTASLANAQLSGTYAVGPSGAFSTLSAAIANLTSQGVSGPVTFTVFGNQTGPFTISAFTGQGPTNPVVIDGLGSSALSGTQPLWTFSGCASVTIRGFTATLVNTTPGINISGTTTDTVIDSCSFLSPATTASTGGPLLNLLGGSNTRVIQSSFGGHYEAFNVASSASGTTIERCRIVGGGFWIARISGPNTTLKNNFITGNSNFGVSCGVTGNGVTADGLSILNNSFYIVHTAAGSQYCTLRWYSNATNTEVRNNILVDILPITGTPMGFNLWCSGALRPTVMNNNIFWTVGGIAPVYASVNLTLLAWQALGFDLNSQVADPQYLNPAAPTSNLALSAASPAIFAGATIPSVMTDIFGSTRIPPYDIGAHEFSANNLLTATTSGGGVGDLSLSLTAITPTATEGYTLLSLQTLTALGTGPILGIWPDALTWQSFTYVSSPGNPFHYPVGIPGVYPATPFNVGPSTLSSLNGVSLDLVTILLNPVGFVGASNVARVTF